MEVAGVQKPLICPWNQRRAAPNRSSLVKILQQKHKKHIQAIAKHNIYQKRP
jgi:hypothetical protein